jgi:hypothetical protein
LQCIAATQPQNPGITSVFIGLVNAECLCHFAHPYKAVQCG